MTITSEDLNKYFQDLLAKHFELVKRAEAATLARVVYDNPGVFESTGPNAFEELVASLMGEYGDRKHAEAIADELISRYRFPDGGGAGIEGSVSGWASENTDIDVFADQDPPEPVSVGVRVPDTKRFLHLQK